MSNTNNKTQSNALQWSLDTLWNKAVSDTPIHERGREGVIQDYLQLYAESGIVEYFAQKIQSECNIPDLDPNIDSQLVIIPINESETIEEEKSSWYEGLTSEEKEKLDKKIKEVIKKLYLPGSSFHLLLNHFLYRDKIRSLTPLFDEYMIECIAFGIAPIEEKLGFKKSEIRRLEHLAIFYLEHAHREKILTSDLTDKEKHEELQWTDKQIELVPKRCEEILKHLERKKRPLRTLHEDLQIINELKVYKTHHEEFDPYVDLTSKWKITSQYIMEERYPEMLPSKLKKAANNFRKHVERLIKKYPFLSDLIVSQKF